jgi:hypothetical protein
MTAAEQKLNARVNRARVLQWFYTTFANACQLSVAYTTISSVWEALGIGIFANIVEGAKWSSGLGAGGNPGVTA